MSKILLFEDWEKTFGLLESLVKSGVPSAWNGVSSILLGKELKAIEFEAVAIEYSPPSESYLRVLLLDPMKLPKDKFKNNNKLQVFIVNKGDT